MVARYLNVCEFPFASRLFFLLNALKISETSLVDFVA